MTTNETNEPTIGVILGSVRQGRFGEAVAHWVVDAGQAREGFSYQLLDLAEFNVPALTAAVPPGAANKQYENPAVTAWSKAVDACDGFVFVTPEYNHSVPGAMKNAFDSLGPEWAGKPVAFVGYGADKAIRAVEHWRQIVANFSMFDVRNQVGFSIFGGEFDEAKAANAGALDRMLTDLEGALSARG